MSEGITIPQIAITPSSSDVNLSTNNMGDTLTDVEDLEETIPKKIKSKLKIKLSDNGGTTDVEDLEGSDSENDTKIQCVSIDDLHLDSSNFEESAPGTSGRLSQVYKTKSQGLLDVSPENEGLTDVENVATDEEIESDELPDVDINLDEYQPDHIEISSDMKQNLEIPAVDANDLTDVESVPSDSEQKCSIKKVKTKKRKTRNCNKNRDVHYSGSFKYWSGMKKSTSNPICLNQQPAWSGFDSDGDVEEDNMKVRFCKQKNKSTNVTKESDKSSNSVSFVDIEESSDSETDLESLDDHQEERNVLEIMLPAPVRTVVFLSENKSLVPTTKILPLDETIYADLTDDQDGGTTDVECFVDDDVNYLFPETYQRGPTPDVFQYENSNTMYGENQLALPKNNEEPVTDTEDLVSDDRTKTKNKRTKKAKNKTLKVDARNESAITDTEDFYFSDSNKSPLKRQNVVGSLDEHSIIPSYMKHMTDSTISSKDSNSTSSAKNLLNVKSDVSSVTPNLTDVEDIAASAEEDGYVETDISNEFSQHLEQQRSSRVHIESTKKLNLDSATEVMYLKGGAYLQNHTDIEDISDDNELGVREWDVSKKSAPQEEAPVPQDAEQQGEESSFAAAGGPQDPTFRAEGEESGQQTDKTSSQQKPVTDQHQLSEEMKQLLKELEKESKQ